MINDVRDLVPAILAASFGANFSTIDPPTPPTPIDPPLNKCNYFINKNDSVVVFDASVNFGGIPQNLLFNLIGWSVLMLLFSILRRAAGNYGRLALLRKGASFGADRLRSKWTQIFFAPDEVAATADNGEPGAAAPAGYGADRVIGQQRVRFDHPDEVGDDPTSMDDDAAAARSYMTPQTSVDDSVIGAAVGGHGDDDDQALADDHGFYSWICSIFTLTDEQYLLKCGHDAVQYLRFQRHLIALTLVITVVCLSVILPVNFQG